MNSIELALKDLAISILYIKRNQSHGKNKFSSAQDDS